MMKYLGILALVILGYLLSIVYNPQWDLTQDKRYTISAAAKEIVAEVDREMMITVLLEGNVPPSFRNYRSFIDYYLNELRRANDNINIVYKDPTEGSPEEIAQFKRYLQSYGVAPISRRVTNEDELSQSVIYPYISVHTEDRVIFVNLLDSKRPEQTEEEAILSSQVQLENKLMRAVRDLSEERTGLVAVIGGQNQLLAQGLNDLRGSVGNYFYFPMNGRQLMGQMDTVDMVISLLDRSDLPRESMLAIDQAIMSDIPVAWLINKYNVSVDSIARYGEYIALPMEYVAEDMLFKYGVRLSTEMLMSMSCAPIPQVVGQEGGQAQTMLIPYPYHPLVQISDEGVLPQSSDPVLMKYTTPIESIDGLEGRENTALIETSDYTHLQPSPVSLGFDFLRVEPDPADYGDGPQVVATAVTGLQRSYFANRLSGSDREMMQSAGKQYISETSQSRQVMMADADFAMPAIGADGSLFPIGYNYWDRQLYDGNQKALAAILEYLVNGTQLNDLSEKEISISLIDPIAFEKRSTWYYFILIGLPVLIGLLLTLLVKVLRKYRYASRT